MRTGGAGNVTVTVQSGATFGDLNLAGSSGGTNTVTIAGTVNSVVANNTSTSIIVSGRVNGDINLDDGSSVELDPTGSFGGFVNASGTGTFILGGSGSGTFDLSNLGTTIFAGQFTKQGSSTWTLTGTNGSSMPVTVNGGTLEVGDANHPGTTFTGSATVGSSGTLSGHGTITGNVTSNLGGIVAPGGTIGTLSVGGNYTQGSNSTLQIEVSPTAASQLNVTGTANLAGTLSLVYQPGVYTGRSFAIVKGGNVTGTFAQVTSNASSQISQTLGYTTTGVNLSSTGSFTVAPTNATTYTATASTLLNGSLLSTDILLSRLSDFHMGTGADSVRTALAVGEPAEVAFAGSTQELAALVTRLPDAMSRYGGWFRALGNFSAMDGNADAPGFDSQGGGFLAGLDREIAENLRAGVAGGYTRTNVGVDDGTSGTIDTPRVMLYGTYTVGALAFDASVGYAFDRIDAARPIPSAGETARSSHNGHEISTAMQASYRYDAGDNVILMPKVGLEYVHLFEAGFAETGAPGFDLTASSANNDSLRPFIGGSVAKTYHTEDGVALTPRLDVAYSRELLNLSPTSLVTVGGGSFSLAGVTPSRDQVTVGGGLTARMDERLALFAHYSAILHTGNTTSQTIEAGLRYNF